MRLAVFNVENLFDRPRAMNLDSWANGKPILDAFAALTKLLGEPVYTAAAKAEMTAQMTSLGLDKDDEGPFVVLRRSRGNLLRRPRTGGIEITAAGRADWIGSLELRREPINENAVRNTARVIEAVGADVLGVVEAENRPGLSAFNEILLPSVGGRAFRHVMLIDGNDPRGIDVGLMTRSRYPIGVMHSRVDDRNDRGVPLFSRDCPDFTITTAAGNRLVVMVNHLKSKGFGSPASNDARRMAQATRVADLYRAQIAAGQAHVAILGDFNDTPGSAPLAPLLAGTDLKDISALPGFADGGFAGTFGSSSGREKFDYILLSPALFALASRAGVERRGMWAGVRPRKWEMFPEVTREVEAASDHAALWVDLDF
ncbi:endonuclease/exonuclease/phosphatase family protein [Sandarakinorhabdus sp.]|uniref:endonuclease/exonuclease/phosphatase family protein n=1 Tax=Sandarakinorhabdus sp. TaxID=1916663 RepID=UPI00286DD729|nr:endonuclease/exonuclease/phosphatase family protein [Sandarakinorhabdus sp.]